MTSFPREENRVPVIGGVSSLNKTTPTPIAVDPVTNAIIAEVSQALPTATLNPSMTVSYNAAGDVVKIEKVIGGVTYTKTLTRSDNTVASTLPISAWS
jgi:hypothetical protein